MDNLSPTGHEALYFTVIHCDGGARPNPGPAAYAAILQHGHVTKCVRGYAPHATNNQMELAAVIAALHALVSTKIPVKVVVDSQYVYDGASRWLKVWGKNGWRTSEGKLVKNAELWRELEAVAGKFVIEWIKVEGHAGVAMNNRADDLVWDTRQAEGDPAKYRVTDIPAIASKWSYNASYPVGDAGFQTSQPVNPQVAALRQRFQNILTCSQEIGG